MCPYSPETSIASLSSSCAKNLCLIGICMEQIIPS